MSPKLILWLVFVLISVAWFALDPQAGGSVLGVATAPTVVADGTPSLQPRIAVNQVPSKPLIPPPVTSE